MRRFFAGIATSMLLVSLLFLAPSMPAQRPAQSIEPPTPHALDEANLNMTVQPWSQRNESLRAEQAQAFGVPPLPEVERPSQVGPAKTVSAEVLRHPLTKKGRSLLLKAQKYSHLGDHAKAIWELTSALKEISAEPYAHGLLGVEYLKMHRASDAVVELRTAAEKLPKLAAVHSNLGLALCQTGQLRQGLREVETALNLDQGLLRAHFLKGVILLDQGHLDRETRDNLELAQKEVPTARLALAIFYERDGQTNAALQQVESYAAIDTQVTEPQVKNWLAYAMSGVTPATALGMWSKPVQESQ